LSGERNRKNLDFGKDVAPKLKRKKRGGKGGRLVGKEHKTK